MRPQDQTLVEINLSNVLHNIKEIRRLIGPHVKIMAVVKADAYGHGAVSVSKAIEKKVDYLAVATLPEAVELRCAGIKKPILILSETRPDNAKEIVKMGFIQTVYTYKLASALSAAADKLNKKAVVHMKIDTGMGRIGVNVDNARELFERISRLPSLKIEGIFTHFAKADENNGFTREQLKKFNAIVSKIGRKGIILHAANSAGTLYHKASHLDMVRIGLSMYGIYPPGAGKGTVELKAALQFKTHIVFIKNVPAGTPISYGSTYVTKRATNIATLPVGYADGLPRALSNKGHVLIRGKRYPIVGRVCMDLTLIDVGRSDVKEGDEVVLIGSQGKETIPVDEVAGLADTISYEIICGIGKRVPRVNIK